MSGRSPTAPPPVAELGTTAPRHRSPYRRRPRWSALAPLAAITVTCLVSARVLRSTPLADDGALTAPAWSWLHGGPAPAPLTPDGLATVHTAGWAALTGAFQRHTSLAAAGRELLWTTLLLSGLLLWALARRTGLRDGPTAVAVLAFGAVPGLVLLHAVGSPAALAVPWLLLALILLTTGHHWLQALSVLCLAPAVLLAPDVALLMVAALAAALATGQAGPHRHPRTRVALAALLAPVFVAGVLVLPHWDRQPDVTAPWAAGEVRSLLITGGLLTVGALAAWLLPRWRPLAAGLAVTTLAAVAPPGRFSALVVCLPLAALVLGALSQRLVDEPAVHRARPILGVVASAALAVGLVLAAVALPGSRVDDFGAADRRELVHWLQTQVPAATPIAADGLLGDDLRRAGIELGPGGLRVSRGEPTDADDVIARFGSDDAALVVVDPGATGPAPEQQALRRRLAGALLANPTTDDAGQATGALVSGDVDPRLLTLLAGIAAQYGVGIAALPAVDGETGTPVRRAVLDSVDGTALRGHPDKVRLLTTWLSAQRPPYAPATVAPVAAGLLIGFPYASDPDGLVAAAGG